MFEEGEVVTCDQPSDRAVKRAHKLERIWGPDEPGLDACGHWYALQIFPGQEKVAFDHLQERGFGVYLPEYEKTLLKRPWRELELMLPGYVFVYSWHIYHEQRRILECMGVHDLLRSDGQPRVISDEAIDLVRVEENLLRPLRTTMDVIVRRTKRWRQKYKTVRKEVQIDPDDVTNMHTKSYLHEPITDSVDDGPRFDALRKALGLGS